MIRIISLFLLITIVIFSFSYVQKEDTKKTQHITVMNKVISTQLNIDSIKINYWKGVEANIYFFQYSNGKLNISDEYFGYNRVVEDKSVVNCFCQFVDEIYNGKTKLILSEEPSPESDYSTVEAIGYRKGKKIFEKKITLYSNIEFNPKFLEFYDFLDNLVKEE